MWGVSGHLCKGAFARRYVYLSLSICRLCVHACACMWVRENMHVHISAIREHKYVHVWTYMCACAFAHFICVSVSGGIRTYKK